MVYRNEEYACDVLTRHNTTMLEMAKPQELPVDLIDFVLLGSKQIFLSFHHHSFWFTDQIRVGLRNATYYLIRYPAIRYISEEFKISIAGFWKLTNWP
jgi:hypothetical protein